MDKRLLLASPHMSDEGYELEYIHDAFQKNWIAPLGENVNEFEKAMGEFMGKGYPVALSAGTAALHLAMILAGVQAGDTVFCQSLTFSASANPVAYCGAKPVFIDSERETWNMDPAALRRAFALHGTPKAVVVVHLYGIPILFIAWKRLDHRVVFKTLLSVTSTTIFLSLVPRTGILHGDKLAECLIGGILCGCGIGITLWMGGTSGGMDVIGMMLIKKGSHTSIGHVNLFWNMALYAICAAAFNLSTAIYSILFSFISTTAMDKLHMQNINVEVTVVTKILSPEMEHEILVDLHRGITRYEGIGEYTGEPVHIFYILVTKYEISRLRAIVCKHDPHAFIVAKDGAVVYGNYKRKI